MTLAVDKNLFMHDLAVVAIMKNEAPYVKEWLDYHLLAGVQHFYIYDNDSPDNLKEILQPYIDAGIVTYTFYPGKAMQMECYMEALSNYRFFCRYITFIDADEFLFPQYNKTIIEVADEVFNQSSTLAGLYVDWIMYGSNNLETADYSKGVLERFTKRANKVKHTIKTIANPRRINYITTPHYMNYFDGFDYIHERSLGDDRRILINHYKMKSREEFARKYNNSSICVAYGKTDYYSGDRFTHDKDNDVFDDSILKYRNFRRSLHLEPPQIDYEKLINALMQNLAPLLQDNPPPKFFEGKMETFLTCRALSTYLKENVLGKERGELVENLSLKGIYSALLPQVLIGEVEMLLSELPNILPLNYPAVEMIRQGCIKMIPKIQEMIHAKIVDTSTMIFWRDFSEFGRLLRMLKTFDSYEHRKD